MYIHVHVSGKYRRPLACYKYGTVVENDIGHVTKAQGCTALFLGKAFSLLLGLVCLAIRGLS